MQTKTNKPRKIIFTRILCNFRIAYTRTQDLSNGKQQILTWDAQVYNKPFLEAIEDILNLNSHPEVSNLQVSNFTIRKTSNI